MIWISHSETVFQVAFSLDATQLLGLALSADRLAAAAVSAPLWRLSPKQCFSLHRSGGGGGGSGGGDDGGSDSDSQADRRPGTPPMSGTGPGPWAEHYAFPHRFPVGATVWVGQHGPLAGTAHHPRTQVRITSRGWAWGNPALSPGRFPPLFSSGTALRDSRVRRAPV